MFVIEALIMFLFWFLALEIHWLLELIIDSTLLSLMSSIIIYRSIVYPYVTSRDKAYDRVNYLAHHDELTGLYNRRSIVNCVYNKIDYTKNNNIVLFLIDIDNFKELNDTYGHIYGDEVLKQVSNKLKQSLREDDKVLNMPGYIIGRQGGDEFLIILYNLNNTRNIKQIAERIIYQLNENIIINNRKIKIDCSIGISISKMSKESPCISEEFLEKLTKQADVALYYVKNNGKNSYKLFKSGLEGNIKSMMA